MNDTDSAPTIRLSICIGTFNRARFIGGLLESILEQATGECEIVVSDNASTDDTERVVAGFAQRYSRLRYFKQTSNVGLDRNFDRAVSIASGEYCWLMADDDILKSNAIAHVLERAHKNPSLMIVNYECTNLDMSEVTLARRLDIDADRVYSPDEIDRLFVDTADHLIYIGCIVMRRSVWLSRDRTPYYDSLLMHFAVIFQARLPGDTLFVAVPLVAHRDGNPRAFWCDMFEVWMFRWPELIWSLAPSDSAKRKVTVRQPWKSPWRLLGLRASGLYSMTEYRQWILPCASSRLERLTPRLIAMTPGVLTNTSLIIYYSLTRSRFKKVSLLFLRDSPFYLRRYWPFGRKTQPLQSIAP